MRKIILSRLSYTIFRGEKMEHMATNSKITILKRWRLQEWVMHFNKDNVYIHTYNVDIVIAKIHKTMLTWNMLTLLSLALLSIDLDINSNLQSNCLKLFLRAIML